MIEILWVYLQRNWTKHKNTKVPNTFYMLFFQHPRGPSLGLHYLILCKRWHHGLLQTHLFRAVPGQVGLFFTKIFSQWQNVSIYDLPVCKGWLCTLLFSGLFFRCDLKKKDKGFEGNTEIVCHSYIILFLHYRTSFPYISSLLSNYCIITNAMFIFLSSLYLPLC